MLAWLMLCNMPSGEIPVRKSNTKQMNTTENTTLKAGPEFRAARMEYAKRMIATAREKGIDLPCDAICDAALDGILRRDGKTYANPPTFAKNPLGSLLLRWMQWHGGGGYLGGVFSIDMDCGLLTRFSTEPEKYGAWAKTPGFASHAALVAGVEKLGDLLNSLALVLRSGKSNACDAWNRALN
jgi:hypothetical protein